MHLIQFLYGTPTFVVGETTKVFASFSHVLINEINNRLKRYGNLEKLNNYE